MWESFKWFKSYEKVIYFKVNFKQKMYKIVKNIYIYIKNKSSVLRFYENCWSIENELRTSVNILWISHILNNMNETKIKIIERIHIKTYI